PTRRSSDPAVVGGDPIPERRVAADRAVVEDDRPVALDRRLRTLRDLRNGEAFGRRIAANEGDGGHEPQSTFRVGRLVTFQPNLDAQASWPSRPSSRSGTA